MTAPLSKADLFHIQHLERLAQDGRVTYAHRCCKAWLMEDLHPSVRAKRTEAVEALKQKYPLP